MKRRWASIMIVFALMASLWVVLPVARTSAQPVCPSDLASFVDPGTHTWIAPPGVTSVTVEAWGGGGRGGSASFGTAGGGGGGAYSRRDSIAVTPGSGYTVVVGAGATTTAAGGDSYFISCGTPNVCAKGGNSVSGTNTSPGATGGLATSGFGDVRFGGGRGGSSATFSGGGGGSSAGTAANGNYTVDTTTSTGATAPSGGGNGGNAGNVGSAPGGAGGGCASFGSCTGGSGAAGRVVITWVYSSYVSSTSGDWTNGGTWQTGSAPNSTCPVIVASGHTVTLNSSQTTSASASVTVNSGGTLLTGANTLSGAGSFNLNSGGTLGIGSPDGITSSGATGNIQTATRSFDTGANYIYNGTAAQVTGNGLPATVNNLTVNNAAGVSLSQPATVNGTLTLTDGRLTLGSHNLTIASNNAVVGSFDANTMVVADGAGALCKAFPATDSFLYPVGDVSGPSSTAEYSPSTLNFTIGTFGGGAQACVRVVDAQQPNWPGASYPSYITRYWVVTQSYISDFSCTASFTYVDADVVLGDGQTEYALFHKIWNGSSWTTGNQTHVGTNTISTPVSSFSDHTAFSGSPLAVTLSEFSVAQQDAAVLVSWETNSEIDNRGFNLYRGTTPDGWDRQLNELLIPSQSQGNPGGFVYTWLDEADLAAGTTYYYWLEDVDVNGATALHGPVSVDFGVAPTAVTLGSVSASPAAAAPALAWLWVVVAAGAGVALGARQVRRRA